MIKQNCHNFWDLHAARRAIQISVICASLIQHVRKSVFFSMFSHAHKSKLHFTFNIQKQILPQQKRDKRDINPKPKINFRLCIAAICSVLWHKLLITHIFVFVECRVKRERGFHRNTRIKVILQLNIRYTEHVTLILIWHTEEIIIRYEFKIHYVLALSEHNYL